MSVASTEYSTEFQSTAAIDLVNPPVYTPIKPTAPSTPKHHRAINISDSMMDGSAATTSERRDGPLASPFDALMGQSSVSTSPPAPQPSPRMLNAKKWTKPAKKFDHNSDNDDEDIDDYEDDGEDLEGLLDPEEKALIGKLEADASERRAVKGEARKMLMSVKHDDNDEWDCLKDDY